MFLHYGVGEDSWVPWTARRSNQSILKEISPEYSLERLMLKLKLQYFGHLMQRTDSFEKTLMLGKIEGRSRRGWQRMKWLNGITDSMDMRLSKLQQRVKDRGSLVCCSPRSGKESSTTEWLNNKKQMIYFTLGELGLLVLWETLVHVTQVVIAWQGCRLPLSPWPSLKHCKRSRVPCYYPGGGHLGCPSAWQLRFQFSCGIGCHGTIIV